MSTPLQDAPPILALLPQTEGFQYPEVAQPFAGTAHYIHWIFLIQLDFHFLQRGNERDRFSVG